jgi:hypothetical protein
MRKVILFSLIIISKVTSAQTTVAVSGTVTDEKGKPIPFAFISDSQHPYATYTDPNGAFSLMADPASNLVATANYHPETKVKIVNPADIKIVMAGDSVSNSNAPIKPADNNFFVPDEGMVDHVMSINRIGSGAVENLHGSRYLFPGWVHGYAITPKDSIKQSDVYLFNYDKVAGNLLFTRNQKTVLIVVKQEIKGFTLFDENAIPTIFEDVPAIDAKHYLQVLATGPKYKVYKSLNTQFIKASFVTNGITSSGNNYDEYKDDAVYYVVKVGGQPQKVDLKSKSIKLAFATEGDKVKKFFTDNDSDIDENYLKSLGEYMNQ